MSDELSDGDGCFNNVVTWTFYIDDPEGERRLRECLNAPRVRSALWRFDQDLRSRWKYGEDSEQMMTVEQVRELLWEILNENNVDLEE